MYNCYVYILDLCCLYVEHVELVENTYYVAFSMSTCLLGGAACGLVLISPKPNVQGPLNIG